eukprot:353460-Chlamydomonas_euryale.AAC.20
MSSSSDLKPRSASPARTSSATWWKKLTRSPGVPGKRARSSSRCDATPTGQLLVWHTRAMMQPVAIIAAVPKPYSSAPNAADMRMSRPLRTPPSTRSTTRSRSSLAVSTWCASAKPISMGPPACLIDEMGDAPVPPSWPETWITRDDADAGLCDELDRDLGGLVYLVQVVDELREVLDRVDIVVRRRRDERHARLGTAQRRDVWRDLGPRQLATLPGLGALRHLDLKLVRVDQELRRHAKAARSDLLDLGCGNVAVLKALEISHSARLAVAVDVAELAPADRVLAALARVGLAADAVDRDCDRLVRLARDRAQRHAAGAEARHNIGRGLHLIDADRALVRLELQAVTQHRSRRLSKVLHVGLVRLVARNRAVTQADRLVQQLGHRLVVRVELALGARLDKTIVLELGHGLLRKRLGPQFLRLGLQIGQRHAADARHGAAEAHVDDVRAQTVGLEDLRAVVARQQRDAHLGQDLQDALLNRLLEVALRLLDAHVGQLARLDERRGAR